MSKVKQNQDGQWSEMSLSEMSPLNYFFECFVVAISKSRHCIQSTHRKLGDFFYIFFVYPQYIWHLL